MGRTRYDPTDCRVLLQRVWLQVVSGFTIILLETRLKTGCGKNRRKADLRSPVENRRKNSGRSRRKPVENPVENVRSCNEGEDVV